MRHKAKLSATTKAKMVCERAPVNVTAASGEAGSVPTFKALAYSGGVVSRVTLSRKLDADYVIDLAGMTQGRNVKINLEHDAKQRVGHLTAYQNNGSQLEIEGALSAANSHRDEVAASAQAGYVWEGSIEADLSRGEKVAAGKTVNVNGRTLQGPLWVFRKSTLTDFAFVTHGADEGNQLSMAASAAGANEMNEFEKFCASLGITLDHASDEQRTRLQGIFDAQQNGGGAKLTKRSTLAELADAERRENERCESIKATCQAAMKDHPHYIDAIGKLGDEAIANKTDPDRFELDLIRATRSKAGQFRAQIGNTNQDPLVLEAAIAMASGLPNIEKHYKEETLDAVDRCNLRNVGIKQVLLQTAHANGYSLRPGDQLHGGNIRAIVKAAFHNDEDRARLSGFSAVSLPNILGAVANKQILSGYMEVDQTWRNIARIKPVSNFHTQNHYRMLDNLEYEEVGSGGEIRHGSTNEETYTSQAKTYGKMLALTRNQIINDDLGVFDEIRDRLGRGGAKKLANVFWTSFMNNSSFFTTALTNYIEGSTTNLGANGVGLELGVKAFRLMTSPAADGSKKVGQDMNPSVLLVPPELEFIADRLYTSEKIVTGSDTTTPDGNIHRNKYRPVVQWRLSNSSYTGYSTTAWYLFGSDIKPMLVTFLNGNETPIVETSDAEFDRLGIQFRAYHDFGCDKSEYLAGIKSKGAA